MKQKNTAPQLKRTMTAGQMEMISLGGAIGVGLFMGSTSTIKWTGPSVLLAYMFVGLILYIVMRALGEMLYINPGRVHLLIMQQSMFIHWRDIWPNGLTSLNILLLECPK